MRMRHFVSAEVEDKSLSFSWPIFEKLRKKQSKPTARRQKYRPYSPSRLTNAYMMVKEGKMSVRKASMVYQVPDTTLRDRVLGKVDPETTGFGQAPVLDSFEEANLMKHYKTMAAYGYGYTQQESIDIASDYAVQIGKRTADKPFTMNWMRGFLKRWPELRVLKPRGLEFVRAKTASAETINGYFRNLKETLMNYDMMNKPRLIYNVNEKGVTVDHKAPYIVADSSYCPQAVTSGRGKTITILSGGSASGVSIPPYFVFPGKRMRQELLESGSPGVGASISEAGWSNSASFRDYLENHFLKYVPGRDCDKVLLLLDGHRSYISVDLVEWARQRGIIIFILPAHTSHVLQPMDVSCYGPFQKICNLLCHKLMRESAEPINRYNVCAVACKSYTKALTSENIQSGFRLTGIYPFNIESVPREYLIPAEVFIEKEANVSQDQDSQATIEGGELVADDIFELDECVPVDSCIAESTSSDSPVKQNNYACVTEFLNKKVKNMKEYKSNKGKKQRNTISKIVAGKELRENIQTLMKSHEINQKSRTKHLELKKEKVCVKKPQSVNVSEPQPGPSAINLISDASSDVDSEIDPADLCCQCGKFQPPELRNCTSLVFFKWAQCDSCGHWFHLSFCSHVRVLRRGDTFLCPHCEPEQ